MGTSDKIALVTGATGFVGKHLIYRLLNDGWNVHAIVRPNSNIELIKDFLPKPIKIHYYSSIGNELINIIREAKPVVVYHLASLFLAQHKFEDIGNLIQSNITFGTELVDAMVQNGVYNLVNTGTSWQHYNNENYNPVCLYAATKQAFEDILKYYQEARQLRVITLKLFDTYGPSDIRPKIFNLLKRISKSQEELDMSPGEQYLDLVYIDDIIDAFLLAAKYVNSGEYLGDYAISSGQPIQLKELVKKYEEISGKKLNIVWGGRPYRDREVMITWSNGKILHNWTPKVSLLQGLIRSSISLAK